MKPTIQELDAAVRYYECLMNERDELDLVHVEEEDTALTALKFMKVMLEPSDDVLDKLNSYPSHLCHQRAPKIILRSRMKVLVTQSLKEVQAK